MTSIKNESEWKEALRLFHKFCPYSRSYIPDPRFNVDAIYQLTNSSSLQVTVNYYDVGTACYELLEKYASYESLNGEGRVIAIHELANFDIPPIVCAVVKSKRVMRRYLS